MGEIIQIDIDWVKKYARFSGDSLRHRRGDGSEYSKLFWSIAEDGLLEPIELIVHDCIPAVSNGNHRLQISDELSYRSVPVLVLTDDDLVICKKCGIKYRKNFVCSVCPKPIKFLENRWIGLGK